MNDQIIGLLERRPDLSEDEAIEVVETVLGVGEYQNGLSLDDLEFWANSMYPKNGHFKIEITETLKRRVVVAAAGLDEALSRVEQAYRDGEYILDSSHFTGVVFSVVDKEN